MNSQHSYVTIPPWLPIPGTSIMVNELQDAIPFTLPSYMGVSFTALCSLTPIINNILLGERGCGDGITGPSAQSSFSFAESMYDLLMGWAQSLPVSMSPVGDIPYHVAVIQ